MAPLAEPQIPMKKSREAMKVYLQEGPKFGQILKQLHDEIKSGEANNLEARFEDACSKVFNLDGPPLFPFKNQLNTFGEAFGHSICISINDVIAHGTLGEHKIVNGDIVSVDCGLCIPYGQRYLHLDAAFTTVVGAEEEWVRSPLHALSNIIAKQPKDTARIAKIIRETAREYNLKQVVSLTGHGIGYRLHEAPIIYNAPGDFLPVELFNGLCFCAEPIFVLPGSDKVSSFICPTYLGADGWSVITISGEPASHFETTFGIVDGQIVDLVGVTSWYSNVF